MKLIAITIGMTLAGCCLSSAKEVTAAMKVAGMDCDACTIVIRHALMQTKGVKKVDLNVDKRMATIVYENTEVNEPQLQKAIEKSGFKAEAIRGKDQ